ncbi:MAG: acyl-CoA thioesterase [Treponema sp.]|jgi:acyl-CoA thioester hydrolase|nr:acyl-CoA thioesterase [Treponema sp.]
MWKTIIHPRFGDTDALRHINNVPLARWFEEARNVIFEMADVGAEINPETFPLIMAHTDYDFVSEMLFGHEIEVRSGISRIGTKSFTVYQEAWQRGALRAKGHAIIVHYDFKRRESTPLSGSLREKLSAHLVTENAAS